MHICDATCKHSLYLRHELHNQKCTHICDTTSHTKIYSYLWHDLQTHVISEIRVAYTKNIRICNKICAHKNIFIFVERLARTSHICDTFVTHLWHICDTFVTHLWHICDIFVTHLWHICDTFVTHLWHNLRTQNRFIFVQTCKHTWYLLQD